MSVQLRICDDIKQQRQGWQTYKPQCAWQWLTTRECILGFSVDGTASDASLQLRVTSLIECEEERKRLTFLSWQAHRKAVVVPALVTSTLH